MSSLTLLDQGEFSDVYVENLYVDNINADQTGQITINDPVYIGNDTLEQYIRQQITTTGALTYNNNTGLLTGITIDNTNRTVDLFLTNDTILSAELDEALASKWTLDITANTIYNNNTTGTVAVSKLVATGTATVLGGIEAYTYLNSYATLFSNGATRLNGSLTLTGNATFSNNLSIANELKIQNGLHLTGGATMNNGLSVSGGIRITGSSTFNQNLTVNGGIGVGQAPIGGVHRLATKGRIRATAFDGVNDTSGVLETVSAGGYINYLFTANDSKAYYDGNTANLNCQIAFSANNGLQVNGSSVHNSGIYVVGGSEINGGLRIQDGLNVSGIGGASFNNGLLITGNLLEAYQGIYITGGGTIKGKLSVSGNMTVSGTADFANSRVSIGSTGTYSSVGNMRLTRTPSTAEGRKVVFSYGTGSAGTSIQGLEWIDNTTTQGQAGIYGGQQQLYFVSGGTQKLSIGANVDFSSVPYVGGNPITTDSVAEGTRLYYTDARFDTRFATKTTTNLTEGTNLYFTTARARQAISASSPLFYDNTTGVLSLPTNNQTTEWKYSAPTSLVGDRLYFIARLATNSNGDCGLTIKGVIGGYVQNEVAKVDIAINTRGAVQIYGNLETANATLAGVIALADIAMYSQTIGGFTVYDIYIVGKSGRFFSYDLVVNGSELGVSLQTPTNTPITPSGTVSTASVLSSLRVYTISGQVNVGTSANETNVGLKSFKASGGSKIKVESNSGSDAEFWARNTVSSYSWYAHNSVNSMRLYNYTTSTDLMTIANNGRVGIGNLNPQFLLSLSANTDTTIHVKSNSTTGSAELFLHADNISAGGGIYLNGSASTVEGGANTLVVKNELGGVVMRNNSLTGGICITGLNGNVGINKINATATLDIFDNTLQSNAETTTSYDNDIDVSRSGGFGILTTEYANLSNNLGGVSITGSIPVVNFSSGDVDGSFYFNGSNTTTGNYINVVGGVGQAVFDDTAPVQFDFSIYVKQLNGSATNYIMRATSSGNTAGIWLLANGRLSFSNGLTTYNFTTPTLSLNTWYRITLHVNTTPAFRTATLIVDGTSYTTPINPNTGVWTTHSLGLNSTNGFIFYLNNYRVVKNPTGITQDANPLSLRGSGTNYVLLRATKSISNVELTRGGNIVNPLGNFNGSQLKSWRLIEINGPTPFADNYVVNTNRFCKTSMTERLTLFCEFSAYNNVANPPIVRSYFWIHKVDGSYTGLFDFIDNQWYGVAFATRLFSRRATLLPDELPVGNYYIRWEAGAQLRMDFNDRLEIFIQQGVVGG